MLRSRSVIIKLRSSLPPDLPAAQLMARCLVLWSDLCLEHYGAETENGYEEMDKFDRHYRYLYFWRGMSRTLCSVKYLLDALVADPLFHSWIDQAKPNHRELFYTSKQAFDRHRKDIERVRNMAGAHLEKDAGIAIRNIPEEEIAVMELHSTEVLRAKAALSLVMAVFLDGRPREQWEASWDQLRQNFREATKAAMDAMTTAIHIYSQYYPLLP